MMILEKMMVNANAQKWVEELKSGKYLQTKGRLRTADAYCCLGVACELYSKETGRGEWKSSYIDEESIYLNFFIGNEERLSVLPNEVAFWLGLSNCSGTFDDQKHSLAGLNDDGKTFAEIAEVIESEPEGLFGEFADDEK